ncbi:hypothetical protein D3C81_1877280 [compost metagenome]
MLAQQLHQRLANLSTRVVDGGLKQLTLAAGKVVRNGAARRVRVTNDLAHAGRGHALAAQKIRGADDHSVTSGSAHRKNYATCHILM